MFMFNMQVVIMIGKLGFFVKVLTFSDLVYSNTELSENKHGHISENLLFNVITQH